MLNKQIYKLKIGGSNPNIPVRESIIGDDLELADQNSDDENDDDVNNDDVNDDDVNVENNQEEESSSDEEVQINFIEEDEQEQQEQQEDPQLLQDVIREQQLIQSLESQLAGERVLLRMNPNNEQIRNRILELQQQINNLRRGNAQSGGRYLKT